jgi:DNA-binding beta-propeller fold protein YncE
MRFTVRCCYGVVAALAGVAVSSPPSGATSSVYVSGVNAGIEPIVAQFDVGAGGVLTAKAPFEVPTGSTPRGLVVSPDARSVYVSAENGESVYEYDVGAGGALTAKAAPTISTGKLPASIAISPDGKSVYVTNRGESVLSEYDVGPGGELSAKSPATVATGGGAFGVAVSPDGHSVYVTSVSTNEVWQYDVGAGGVLSPKSPSTVADADGPWGIAVSPDGSSVYVANNGKHTVSQYTVGAGGALSPKSPPTVASGNTAEARVSVSPDGKSVYVTNQGGSTVSQYDVGAGGALTPKSPATVAAGSPTWVALSPCGTSAYVTDAGSTSEAQFDVTASGALSPKSPSTFGPVYGLTAAVTPDQGPVAAFSDVVLLGGASAGGVAVFDGSPSGDVDGQVARYDWSFGDGTTAANAGPFPSHFYPSLGNYTVALTVTDDAGCSTAEVYTGQMAYCNGGTPARISHLVAVAPAPSITPVLAATKPTLSALAESNSTFAVARSATPLTGMAAAGHHKGTTFSFRLDQPATVKIAIRGRATGRRVGHRCRPNRPTLRHKKRCTRTITLGTFTRSAHAGFNKVAFSGRIGRRALKPGRYSAVFTATNTVGSSPARSLRFKIVRR